MTPKTPCAADAADATGADPVHFGQYVSYWFSKTPRRALFCLSYYKFASRLIGRGKRVLDVGCSEGLGTRLLAQECGHAVGLDSDADAIRVARANWDAEPNIDFRGEDFLSAKPGEFDAVTNFDVIEHIQPDNASTFLAQIAKNLKHDGMAIIGTPNLETQHLASAVSRQGHINCYDEGRLRDELLEHFHHVFSFVANDEVVHTGYPPTANYLLIVACRKRG
ncbi:MAG: class I SAM-dependent methyltransferase [Planctomycetales bacterium]